MSKKTKTLFSASLAALLLVGLLAGAALAQGPMPWRSGGDWGPGMMGGGNWSQSAPNNWGPGMMGGGFWNRAGGMTGRGMMGSFRQPLGDMTVSTDEAIAAAQDWLNANLPGVMAGDEAEPFYGYYTIHTLTDGEISGMLSVNGSTGQVWYHNWHGDFVEMTGEHE